MVKHLVVIAVLALALPQSASAVPFLKGKIVSSGVSKNNLTTAATFTIPNGPISVLCDAAVYFVAGPTSVTTATSDGFPLSANVEKTMTAVNGGNVFAILPVSGAATCKVFQLNGETITYRGDTGGAQVASMAKSLEATRDYSAHTLICQAKAGEQCMAALHNGTYWNIGPNVRIRAENSRLLVDNSMALGNGQSMQADLFATATATAPLAMISDKGYRWFPFGAAPTASCSLKGCHYVDNDDGKLYLWDPGSSTYRALAWEAL